MAQVAKDELRVPALLLAVEPRRASRLCPVPSGRRARQRSEGPTVGRSELPSSGSRHGVWTQPGCDGSVSIQPGATLTHHGSWNCQFRLGGGTDSRGAGAGDVRGQSRRWISRGARAEAPSSRGTGKRCGRGDDGVVCSRGTGIRPGQAGPGRGREVGSPHRSLSPSEGLCYPARSSGGGRAPTPVEWISTSRGAQPSAETCE